MYTVCTLENVIVKSMLFLLPCYVIQTSSRFSTAFVTKEILQSFLRVVSFAAENAYREARTCRAWKRKIKRVNEASEALKKMIANIVVKRFENCTVLAWFLVQVYSCKIRINFLWDVCTKLHGKTSNVGSARSCKGLQFNKVVGTSWLYKHYLPQRCRASRNRESSHTIHCFCLSIYGLRCGKRFSVVVLVHNTIVNVCQLAGSD